MADLSKFKKMLGLGDEPESFNMTAPENLSVPETTLEEEDESAFAPAMEDLSVPSPKVRVPLASQEEIDQIQSIPMPEAQKGVKPVSPTVTPAQPEITPEEPETAVPQEVTDQDPVVRRKNLLEELQKLRAEKNQNATMLMAGNQIAQALALRHGAKIGDGSEAVAALRKDAEQPIKDYAEQIANEEDDATSDVSKFMRERAYSLLKTINPEKQYDLENMTANQLKKAFGNKLMGSASDKPNTRYVTIQEPDGSIRSKLIDMTTGEVIRDLGYAGYANTIKETPQGMQSFSKSVPTQGGQIMGQRPEAPKAAPGSTEEPIRPLSDYINLGEEYKKSIAKAQDDFIKDPNIKSIRETASALTLMDQKLKPGMDGSKLMDGIDSGMLGGIQTQAAKLAGQKGVLTDQDLVKFAGAGGVPAAIERLFIGKGAGKMTEDDIKFFKAFSKKMRDAYRQDIENQSKYHVDMFKQNFSNVYPVSEKAARQYLGVESLAPKFTDPSQSDKTPVAKSGVEKKLDKAVGKAKRVVQNGITYILNETTGKYEPETK